MSEMHLYSTHSPSKLIFSSDLYRNTEIILDPSYNTTLHSRQGKNPDYQDQAKPNSLTSRYSILNSHLQKEKSRSATAALNKMKIDSIQSQRNFELKSQIQHRRVKSDLVNQNFIQTRVSKVSELNKNIQSNYEKAILTQISNKRRFLQRVDEKDLKKPQKFANTLNKPGVTVWMNLASGGRIRSASLELPAPDAPRVLKTWDIFSGFIGTEVKKKEMEVEMENSKKDQRGFCCKIDPIYQSYSYNQALYYLQLRKKGLPKPLAIQLSQKIHCNLHDKQIVFEKNDSEKDQDYQKLVDRFTEFTSQHPIKEGEIIKDEEYQVKHLKFSTKDPLLCKTQYKKARTEPILESKQEISIETNKIKPKQDPRLLELKKILRKSKLNKSGSINQFSDRTEEMSKTKQEDLIEDCKSFENNEENNLDTQTMVKFSKDKAVKFLINSILPKKQKIDENSDFNEIKEKEEIEKIDDEIEEMKKFELIQAQDRLETIHEGTLEDHVEVKVVQFELPKNLAFIDKIRKSKEKVPFFNDKTKKIIEKKEEINMQNNLILQETLARKLGKLKSLAQQRKKEKEENLYEIKKRKNEFIAKVQSMKFKKEKLSEVESEQVLKRVKDKFETAEANKRKLEVEKEKRREEQRLLYQSQRSFVEYLRSLSFNEVES